MSGREGKRKPGLVEFARFARANLNFFRASRRKNAVRSNLCLANMEIGRLDRAHPLYAQRVREFDQAMIAFSTGKWEATAATKTGSRDAWRRAFAAFDTAERMGTELLARLVEHSPAPVPFTPAHLEDRGTEITFANGIPLVPSITPIVMLQGSDHEMGRQYAQQLVQIFGSWILERHAGTAFTPGQRAELARWEEQHRQHTPWLIEFCRGWSQGARELGIAMTYEDALDRWVGHRPPASEPLGSGGLPELPAMAACSGVAAWGRATSDGALVTGSTGDHDLSYQVTIVAFPDEGHRFIYSPFGATGEIAGAGEMFFFGHPAINDQGLAYVHHGGGPKFLEAARHWGYGLRRAAAVIHILRFCDDARQARATEESWPIGDVGWGDQATVGGFWADGRSACVIEGRRDPYAVREPGLLGERDFLYANNGVAHPRAIESEWMAREKDAWVWDEHGGWRPRNPTGMTKSLGLFVQWASGRLSTSAILARGMRFASTNSCARNRFLFEQMDRAFGRVDVELMKGVYRTGGTIPDGPWKQIERDFVKHGRWGRISTAHASNAMTVVTRPRDGLYALCTGPARRGLAPMMPSANITIHGETNVFWEIRLARTPREVLARARATAAEDLATAEADARGIATGSPPGDELRALLGRARAALAAANAAGPDASVAELAKAVRASTRAQVYARQVSEAVASLGRMPRSRASTEDVGRVSP